MQKKFRLFRYQIIPNSSSRNFDLFESVDQLIASKNQLFMEALKQFEGFLNHVTETNYRTLLHEGDWHVGQIGFKRRTRLTDKNFAQKSEDNFPSIFFIVNNNPDEQLIIIQEVSGMMKPFSFAKRLIECINQLLENQPVEVQVESIAEPTDFWNEIKKAQGKIEALEFTIDTPNMARISKVLPESLKNLSKVTNAKSSKLKLEGDIKRRLNISEDNEDIQALNNYVSQGGGDYKIKLAGIRQVITKQDSVKVINIDEIILEHPSIDTLEFALQMVLENE